MSDSRKKSNTNHKGEFTTDDVNHIVTERLARERKHYTELKDIIDQHGGPETVSEMLRDIDSRLSEKDKTITEMKNNLTALENKLQQTENTLQDTKLYVRTQNTINTLLADAGITYLPEVYRHAIPLLEDKEKQTSAIQRVIRQYRHDLENTKSRPIGKPRVTVTETEELQTQKPTVHEMPSVWNRIKKALHHF